MGASTSVEMFGGSSKGAPKKAAKKVVKKAAPKKLAPKKVVKKAAPKKVVKKVVKKAAPKKVVKKVAKKAPPKKVAPGELSGLAQIFSLELAGGAKSGTGIGS